MEENGVKSGKQYKFSISDIKDWKELVVSVLKLLSINKLRLIHIFKLLGSINASYFYSESLVSRLLFERNFRKLKPTSYVHYDEIFDFYHESELLPVHLEHKKRIKLVYLPYKEEINFIINPESTIRVIGDITNYEMPDSVHRLTQANLDNFLLKKPKTTDDPVVRISDFSRVTKDQYICYLQRSSYFIQARTNLTIDFPLAGEGGITLRKMEMGETRSLKPFKESILLNSIGVSAVVYHLEKEEEEGKKTKKTKKTKKIKRYFFMKLRKADEGVFENMLGTVSGVGTYIENQKFTDLIMFAAEQMKSEFERETGLPRDAIESIKPLSFCRELARGGKPQFFFIIQLNEQYTKKKIFRKKFRESAEGTMEFFDDHFRDQAFLFSAISPEFATNLVYAFQYLQWASGKDYSSVVLK